ncbi:MAG TPA: hypothetical protein VF515_13735, partial [Candidatus Binatia bacterium]
MFPFRFGWKVGYAGEPLGDRLQVNSAVHLLRGAQKLRTVSLGGPSVNSDHQAIRNPDGLIMTSGTSLARRQPDHGQDLPIPKHHD